MAKLEPSRIRNVALLGHSHDGKTMLAEAMLYAASAVDRLGKPEAGTTVFDFDPEEIKRKMTISTGVAHLTWGDTKVNLLDTPGFQDFVGEVCGALSAAEGALLVVSALTGSVVGTELAWHQLRQRALPTLVVVNKMDKENADFWKAVDSLRDFTPRPVAIEAPIGAESGFHGVVDLLARKAFEFDAQGRAREVPVAPELKTQIDERRSPLVEAAAETDDALLEKYLESGELTDAEVTAAFAKGVAQGTIVPVLCAAAAKSIGIGTLLDRIVSLLPSPVQAKPVMAVNGRNNGAEPLKVDSSAPLAALVFKTTADPFVGRISYVKVLSGTLSPSAPVINASRDQAERLGTLGYPRGKALDQTVEVVAGDIAGISKLQNTNTGDTLALRDHPLKVTPPSFPEHTYSAAVTAKNKADEEKVNAALIKLVDEDPTLTLHREPITKETIVQGMGDVHLDVVLEKLKRKYGVEAVLSVPRVPYQETITATARAEKKYKKQSGGAGLYGHCVIEVAPVPRGTGFVWEDRIFGGAIPQNFRPSVEKGVKETMEQGVLSGNPVVDVKVGLLDGSTHPVDGKDIAFKLAGAMAMRQAILDAHPVLLEPIMDVEVVVPERNMGDVISDLNGKRGKIAGMEPAEDHMERVKAQVPLSSMYRFPIDLRSITQGRGSYHMAFSHYEEVPAHVAQPVIQAYQKAKSGEEEA
ncbi:MAG TPA: elongation factor G [Candidatus Limnocylindrales bacterium]|nr:elongation factor G [Candidatus Limnocylindrales bacterium]